MTVEPTEGGKAAERRAPITAGPEPSETSPLRWACVVAPLLVIIVAGTNLMGLWTTTAQQAAHAERLKRHAPTSATGETAPIAAAEYDVDAVVALVAEAKAEDGAQNFRMCSGCHPAEKNAPRRIAPTLWGIVGAPKTADPDFGYSAALRAKGGTWTYRELAEYLHDPRRYAPGTSMAFAGISANRRIASLLAYLRTLSDIPAPLPR